MGPRTGNATKLTTKAIRAWTYRGGWDVRWDQAVTGLGLRIYPSGKKSFVLSYRSGGRKRMMVLGTFGVMTIDEARRQASKKLVSARDGNDPLDEKRRATKGQTFGDLATAYIEDHAKPNKKTWKEDERRLKQHTPAGWRGRRAASITRVDVSPLYAKIRARAPYEANRFLALLRHLFRLGQEWGYIAEGTPNPAVVSKEVRFKERKRKRWVTPEELPALAHAIDQEPNIYVRSGIWLLLLTGLRKAELLAVRRHEDIDWTRGVLRLPETKSGEEQSASLSGPALAIMQATPAMDGNPYLLPGAKKGHHLVNIDLPWRRIRKAAGLEDVRLHDLRRTVGSWMTQDGVDLNKIKDALRHSDISTTLVYARLGQDAARKPMEDHGRRILEAAGRRGPLVVVEGGARKK